MKSISWSGKLAMIATFGMLTAFTVLVSSSYIFTLRLFLEPKQRVNALTVNDTTVADNNHTELLDVLRLTQPDEGDRIFMDDLLDSSRGGGLRLLPARTNSTNTESMLRVNSFQYVAPNGAEVSPILRRIRRSWLYGNASPTADPLETQNASRMATEKWVRIRKLWGNSKIFVLTSSGLVFIGGLVQFFTSAHLVLLARGSAVQYLHRLTTRWIVASVAVCLVLVTCVTSNCALQSDPEKSVATPELLSELESHPLDASQPEWMSYMINNIYNLIVLMDACGLLLLVGLAACLLNTRPVVYEPQGVPQKSFL